MTNPTTAAPNARDQQIEDAALELCKYDGVDPNRFDGWDCPLYTAVREIERFLFVQDLTQNIKSE